MEEEYVPASSSFSEDEDSERESNEVDGYTFAGYTIEVSKKIELIPSVHPLIKS